MGRGSASPRGGATPQGGRARELRDAAKADATRADATQPDPAPADALAGVRHAPAASSRFAFFPSMGEYPAYDNAVYDAFDEPDARHRAYRDAIRAVAPGKVVLDIGTGRDALWAVEAARAGARHVYAIEAHPVFAEAAAATIARAGLSDQVTLLPGLSTEQTLPVRAEVCISEIIGNVASAEGMIPALNDARARLCTPDCTWIPFRAQTWAAAIDLGAANQGAANQDPISTGRMAPEPASALLRVEVHDLDTPVFATEALRYLAAIFTAAGGPFDVRLCLAGPVRELLVSEPALIESLVFDSRRSPSPESETTKVKLRRLEGRMTGLLLWTRVAVTSNGREIDALSDESRGWAPVYLPLSTPPTNVDSTGSILMTPSTQAPSTQAPSTEAPPTQAPSTRETPTWTTVAFARRTSDDLLHPDYEVTVDGQHTIHSPHHGGGFRRTGLYRRLFAG